MHCAQMRGCAEIVSRQGVKQSEAAAIEQASGVFSFT
jgi:hypothetical protein